MVEMTDQELREWYNRYQESRKRANRKYQKKHRQEINSRRREYMKMYTAKNKERIRAYYRAYYKRNKEHMLAQQKEYKKMHVAKNKERFRAYHQEYYKANKERILAQQKQHRIATGKQKGRALNKPEDRHLKGLITTGDYTECATCDRQLLGVNSDMCSDCRYEEGINVNEDKPEEDK